MKRTNKYKKILLITYHFPPSSQVGGLRIAKFAKYLPLYHWSPYVLTVKEGCIENSDQERLDELNNLKIYRTNPLPTVDGMHTATKKLYKKIYNKGGEAIQYNPYRKYHPGEKIKDKLKRYILSFLTIPDSKRSWIIPAFIRAILEIRREGIRCILTSSPPHSVHLIGLLVKRVTGVQWVADFRDPWMTGDGKRFYHTSDLSLKIDRWLERKVIKNADMVLTTTDRLCDKIKAEHHTNNADKFLCIPNGFDGEYFSRFKQLGKYDKFTLTHAGTFYLGRTPEPVFQSLNELDLEGKIRLQEINVKLIGEFLGVNGVPVSQMVHTYGLDGVVEMPGLVPYSNAIEIIRKSHLALLFAPDQPFQIPAKVFDYMGAGTRILAISKDGSTADLVRSTGIGAAFHPSDIEGMKKYIHDSIANRQSALEEISEDTLTRFERMTLTGVLANRLDATSPHPPPKASEPGG